MDNDGKKRDTAAAIYQIQQLDEDYFFFYVVFNPTFVFVQDDSSLTDCGSLCKSGPLFSPQRAVPGVCGVGGGKGISPSDCSIDSLNMAERDECWLLEETGDGASQLLCRTNMTNYTLAWSSSASGTDQDLDYNEPGNDAILLPFA